MGWIYMTWPTESPRQSCLILPQHRGVRNSVKPPVYKNLRAYATAGFVLKKKKKKKKKHRVVEDVCFPQQALQFRILVPPPLFFRHSLWATGLGLRL